MLGCTEKEKGRAGAPPSGSTPSTAAGSSAVVQRDAPRATAADFERLTVQAKADEVAAERARAAGDTGHAARLLADAAARYQAAHRTEPNKPNALYWAGQAELARGDAPAARRLFDRAVFELERQLHAQARPVERVSQAKRGVGDSRHVAWSANGSFLALATGNDLGFVQVTAAPHPTRTLISDRVTRIVPAGGAEFVTGARDGQLELWRASDGSLVWSVTSADSPITGIALAPDERRVIVASASGLLEVRSALDGSLLRTLNRERIDGGFGDVALAGKDRLAVAGNTRILLWDLASGRQLRQVSEQDNPIVSLAISEDTAHLATAGADGTSRVWRLRDGSLVRRLAGHGLFGSTVAFHPTTHDSLVTSSTAVRVWTIGTGAFVRKLGDARNGELAFDPQGGRLATAPEPGKISIWNSRTGVLERTLSVSVPKVGAKRRFCRIGPRVFANELCAQR